MPGFYRGLLIYFAFLTFININEPLSLQSALGTVNDLIPNLKLQVPDLGFCALYGLNVLPSLKLALPLTTCDKPLQLSLVQPHPDQNKKTPQILEAYRYPFKTYNITTEDGYILTVYRVTGSPNRNPSEKMKGAVYLNPGLASASDCWNFQPGSRNLPFKLADAGFDVWMANARGSSYSLKHTKYKADRDLPYWNFSFHEMAIHDVPAVTKTILKETQQEKIFYIGHSMGTTQYFIALSEIPELNEKFHAGFLLAPIALLSHMYGLIRALIPLISTDTQYQNLNQILRGRIENTQQLQQAFGISVANFCSVKLFKCGVCDNLIFLLFGYNGPQINSTELPNIVAKFPNNIAVKSLAHYAQITSSCTFRQYDYGAKNPEKYGGSRVPPSYDLGKIRTPTYFFYAEQDNLGPPVDVEEVAKRLTPGVLKLLYKIPDLLFNHVDFLTGIDADKVLYNRMLSEMLKFTG